MWPIAKPSKKNLSEKRAFVLEKGLCLNCLKGKHIVKQCPSPHSCLKCGKRHHTLLHVTDVKPPEGKPPESPKPPASGNSFTPPQNSPAANNSSTNSSSTNSSSTNSGTRAPHSYAATSKATSLNAVLMMTAEVIVSSPFCEQITVRALLDPASTASFFAERVAQHQKLRRTK